MQTHLLIGHSTLLSRMQLRLKSINSRAVIVAFNHHIVIKTLIKIWKMAVIILMRIIITFYCSLKRLFKFKIHLDKVLFHNHP